MTGATGDTGNVGFRGDWTDPNTGQVDLGARWYQPGTRSFVSRDSVRYASGDSILANRYTYAAGRSVGLHPADGHWPKWLNKAVNTVRSAVGSVVRTASSVVSSVYSGLQAGWNYAWSCIRSAATWVYDKAKTVVTTVVNAVKTGVRWFADKAKAVPDWAKQKAAELRAKAIAHAKAVTQATKKAVATAIKYSVLPVLAAATKPLLTDLTKLVSAAASLPAKVVSTVRNVVNVAKSVQVLYDKAVEQTGAVVENVSKAVQAATEWVVEHKAAIAGFVAGGVGCGLLIGWTGVGAVACGALVGVVRSVVHDMVEGGHGWKEMLGIGGVLGGITGGLGSVLGSAIGAGIQGPPTISRRTP